MSLACRLMQRTEVTCDTAQWDDLNTTKRRQVGKGTRSPCTYLGKVNQFSSQGPGAQLSEQDSGANRAN